ncbi:MAG: hypothetical protein D6819_10685 [Gammaproteobacteria bacterium]|nr:MAG: hypothetical protein D6819_10685 [Gammaproteobacteria bacterium]
MTFAWAALIILMVSGAVRANAFFVYYDAFLEKEASLLEAVIDGIRRITNAGVYVADHVPPPAGAKALIGLGPQGAAKAVALADGIPVVAGLVIQPPAGVVSGYSIAPDPGAMFRLAKEVMGIQRVIAVSCVEETHIEIRDGMARIRDLGLAARLLIGKGTTAYLARMGEAMDEASAKDLIWTPYVCRDNLKGAELPIIRRVWDRSLVLASSHPDLIRYGFLLTAVPRFDRLGEGLGRLAKEIAGGKAKKPFTLSPFVEVVVNAAVARHIGVSTASFPRIYEP